MIYMKSEVLNLVIKSSKKYNKKEILFLEMIKKCKEFGYNTKETELLIREFEDDIICY